MVRGGKKAGDAQFNPELEERKRLKKLAISKNILSDAPAKASTLIPSKTVLKHHGADILRKSQRKNRFLFSFPGLFAPISGGKIGELKDLGTKNPILYLDFPQGQMKLFGTIVFPKNRYLTLQFSRGGKNVTCEDYFDTVIVFSDAWWIGKKDENPEEACLEFPKELTMGQHAEHDFKGGAGVSCERKQDVKKPGIDFEEKQTPKTELEDDLSDSQIDLKDKIEVTPTRHSARTAGKRYKLAEASSGDDSAENNTETSEAEENKVGLENPNRHHNSGKINDSSIAFSVDNADATTFTSISEQIQRPAMSVIQSKDVSRSNKGSLVQATISTLFKKVEEKKVPEKQMHPRPSKGSSQILQNMSSKRKKDQAKGEDDDMEEFSSTSQDDSGSDEDWAA